MQESPRVILALMAIVSFFLIVPQELALAQHQLTSVEECAERYLRRSVVAAKDGTEFFWGHRTDISSKCPVKTRLFKFDAKTLQVTPVLSDEVLDQYFEQGGGSKPAVAPAGNMLVVSRSVVEKAETVAHFYYDLLLIDVDAGSVDPLVQDRHLNYSPSFSPDGKRVAFYSTDRSTNPRLLPGIPLKENAACVVGLKTKTVTNYLDHFIDPDCVHYSESGSFYWKPPRWLDTERVLFTSLSTDAKEIASHLEGYAGETRCYYIAIANVQSASLKKLFLRGKAPPEVVSVDQESETVVLANRQQIVRTDFEIKTSTVVAEVSGSQHLARVRVENGEIKYDVRER